MTAAAGGTRRVVLVDESPERARTLAAALEESGCEVDIVRRTGEAAEAAGEGRADAVLVRLEGEQSGIEGLRELSAAIARGVPVIALAAADNTAMRRRALAAGARDYVAGPDSDHEELVLRLGNALEVGDIHRGLEGHVEELERMVEETTRSLEEVRQELQSSQLESLQRLALAAEYRDDATHEHPQRVARTAALIARRMGLGDDQIELLRHAAQLHDIGNIGVPDEIMLKPAPLDEDEFELMKTHTVIGWQILSGSSAQVLSIAGDIALSHHERFDGSGYPGGLAGDTIPLLARITAVADVFDTLTHIRPYREAFPVERAVEEIRRLSRTQFDPRVVGAFDLLEHAALLEPVAGP